MPTLLVQGIAIGFSAGIAPGPLIAIFLDHASRFGWRRTLPAIFAPLISDGPIIVVSLLLLSRLPGWFLTGLQITGGIFLITLAARMLIQRRQETGGRPAPPPRSHPIWTAAAVNLINPNPYIFWGTVIGPILVSEWRNSPGSAMLFVGGFYLTMMLVFAGWIIFFGQAAVISPGIRKVVTLVSALGMAGFGIYQLGPGLAALADIR